MKRDRCAAAWRVLAAGLLVTLIGAGVAGHADAQDHSRWDGLVRDYVDDDGRVAYRRLQTDRAAELEAYLEGLGASAPDGWSTADQLAFWINAYNAVIVAGVLDGYAAEGVWQRWRLFKTFRRRIAGRDRSPAEIEHGVLGARFADPRVHFALVCASSSCPLLRREAYTGAALDAQLADQARRFLHDHRRNRIDPRTGRVELSAIFKWFADDFGSDGPALARALRPYLGADEVALLERGPIEFLPYDWSLNAQPGQSP